MSGRFAILVKGRGYAAPLAALTLARFAVADPARVCLDVAGGEVTNLLVLRPDMAKLHHAIGLDLVRAGARPTAGWTAPNGAVMPFASPKGEGGAGFQHLATRARRAGLAYGPAPGTRSEGLIVRADAYEALLTQHAARVGVLVGTVPQEASLTVTASGPEGPAWRGDEARVGMAVLETGLLAVLGPHILHRTLMALVSCLSDGAGEDVLRREYARRVSALRPCLRAMEALLVGGDAADTVHRKRLWAASGHLVASDDDPFSAAEWAAALTAAAGEPHDHQRLADAVPLPRREAARG